MLFRETTKNLTEAKRLEQRAVAEALVFVVKAHHAEKTPLGKKIINVAQESDGYQVAFLIRVIRQALAEEVTPLLHDLCLAIFVGAPLFSSLQRSVENLPIPTSTLDLFSVTRKKAARYVESSSHGPWYYISHPRILWSALMSTYLGSRLFGRIFPFDPKAFALNASGRIFEERFCGHHDASLSPRSEIASLSSTERDRRDVEERDDVHSVLWTRNDPQQIEGRSQPNREVISLRALTLDWTVGPTPTVGDLLAREAWGAIEGLHCRDSICFPHSLWIYVNLQNRCGMAEARRSKALFDASRTDPHIFRLASVSVDAPWYVEAHRRGHTLQDQKNHLLKELYKGLDPLSADWYAFSLQEGERDEWWHCVERVVERAFCIAEMTDTPSSVFHELVVLGLVRSWQAFCCRKTQGRVISTIACKECADRGGSVNAAFLWALCEKDETTRAQMVKAVLWGRPLLARQRLIEKRRTRGFEALVRSLHPTTVRHYLDELWKETNPSFWHKKEWLSFS